MSGDGLVGERGSVVVCHLIDRRHCPPAAHKPVAAKTAASPTEASPQRASNGGRILATFHLGKETGNVRCGQQSGLVAKSRQNLFLQDLRKLRDIAPQVFEVVGHEYIHPLGEGLPLEDLLHIYPLKEAPHGPPSGLGCLRALQQDLNEHVLLALGQQIHFPGGGDCLGDVVRGLQRSQDAPDLFPELLPRGLPRRLCGSGTGGGASHRPQRGMGRGCADAGAQADALVEEARPLPGALWRRALRLPAFPAVPAIPAGAPRGCEGEVLRAAPPHGRRPRPLQSRGGALAEVAILRGEAEAAPAGAQPRARGAVAAAEAAAPGAPGAAADRLPLSQVLAA
mmetsp:Transcript_86038/g.248417  ORF Transcript_86038/g.248417 Transcript_86038/m.248417 type:complete len:339 (+) Transcript_86038:284-1300(+)